MFLFSDSIIAGRMYTILSTRTFRLNPVKPVSFSAFQNLNEYIGFSILLLLGLKSIYTC